MIVHILQNLYISMDIFEKLKPVSRHFVRGQSLHYLENISMESLFDTFYPSLALPGL